MSTDDDNRQSDPAKPKFAAISADTPPARAARPCPNCGKMSVAAAYPFCSKRCRMVDLNRWLTGAYAIPVVESDEDDE
jgi:endogenous inhibitor of DNA gyrase (YacG/DUF329 family)